MEAWWGSWMMMVSWILSTRTKLRYVWIKKDLVIIYVMHMKLISYDNSFESIRRSQVTQNHHGEPDCGIDWKSNTNVITAQNKKKQQS